jgi:WD40 repeat protein/tetratricopeptide (TPR) repeat protein
VPVFEVGRADGQSYYAMQLIQGQGLDQVIDELCRLRAESGRDRAATTSGGADPRPGEAAGPVARSLLTGRFAGPLPAVPTTPPTVAPAPAPASPATEGYVPKVDSEADTAPAATGLLSSAVLPGAMELSSVESNQPHYFRGVARIGQQVAQALAYAHARGIVHRDIKPSNLLLDAAGVIWVTDFGLAKTEDDGLTRTGDLLGTLRYMAPERLRGECDVRADVYALGLTLYELLALKPAFEASDRLKLLEHIRHQEPARPRALDGRIPRDLETIVLKASDKDPTRRYQTAEALAEDLRRFLADEPIQARQLSPVERLGRWCRRNPVVAALAAAVCLSLLLGTGIAALFAIQAQANEKRAQQNALEASANEGKALKQKAAADQARSDADTARRELQENLYFAEMHLAGQAAESPGGARRVHELLARWRPKGNERDLRGWEWYYLRGLGEGAGRILQKHTDIVLAVSWSPDGNRLASCGSDHTVRLWDAAGRETAVLHGHGGPIWAVQWSPDSQRLASASDDGTVRVWDADTGRQTASLGHRDVKGVSWSPDGRRLASAGYDRMVRVWDATTGRPIHTLAGHTRRVWAVSWSPDGRLLASAGEDRTIKLWDPATAKPTATLLGHDSLVYSLSWSPDSRHLASAGGDDRTVKLWEVATRRNTRTLGGHSLRVAAVSWSPDGRWIASASSDQTVKLWDAATGAETAILRGHTNWLMGVSWSPDSQWLASASHDQTVRLWKRADQQRTSPLLSQRRLVTAADWGPDGRRLVCAGADRVVRLWDVESGREVAAYRGLATPAWKASLDRDGQRVALAEGWDEGASRAVSIWDVKTGRVTALTGHGNPVRALSWSPDGQRLATSGYNFTVRLWDPSTGRQVHTLRGHTQVVSALSWSPDSRRLASAGDDSAVKVWDANKGREIASLTGFTGGVSTLCWSPDGNRLASLGSDQVIKLWDMRSRRETVTLRGHTALVSGLTWSPDSRRLASGSADGTVKIWDVVTGRETFSLRGHSAAVMTLVWSRDGRRLASCDADHAVKLWTATPGYVAEQPALVLPELDRRLKANPHSVPDRRLRAEIQARLGRWDEAATDWTTAARLQKVNPPRWFSAGWWVVGPFPAGPDAGQLPTEPDPLKPLPGARRDGPPLRWQALTSTANGCLDLSTPFPQARTGTAYALLRVYCPRQLALAALLGSTGRVRLWLNGRLRHEADEGRSSPADADAVPLTLRAGWNTLFFQTSLGTGTDRLHWWLSDAPADQIRAFADSGQWDQAAPLVAEALKRPSVPPALLLAAGRSCRRHADRLRYQGREDQAQRIEQQGRTCLEKLLARRPNRTAYAVELADFLLASGPIAWTVLDPAQMASAGGTTFHKQPDGSILASGNNPLPETYTITAATKLTGIRAVRLELLPDPRLPGNGPGRAPNGNLVLNGFRVTAAPEADLARARPVALHNAWADFAQSGFEVDGTIDNDPESGWAVVPETGKAHRAVFETKEPISDPHGTLLTFTLEQRHRHPDMVHNLGRFRLAVMTRPQAVLVEKLRFSLGQHTIGAWTALAAVHYLRAEHAAALAALGKAMPTADTGTGSDRFLLCLAHAGRGQHEQARKCYDDAVAWLAKNPGSPALTWLAVEAASERIKREPRNAGLWLQRARWHTQEEQEAEAVRDLTRALELDRALALQPADAQILMWRGDAAGERGEWRKALADFAWGAELSAASANHHELNAELCHHQALLCLHLGDSAGYRKVCATLVGRFGTTTDRNVAGWVAWACALAPEAVADREVPVRLAEVVVKGQPSAGSFLDLGAALYRAGKYEAAIQRLTEAVRADGGQGSVLDWLFLAMAHHRLGRADEARKWLAKAARWLDDGKDRLPESRLFGQAIDWSDRLEFPILRREAEALLRKAAPKNGGAK